MAIIWISLDRTLNIPLKKQAYDQLRTRIVAGELTSGMKLPSSRTLASELQVSRNLIVEVYEQLIAEGYVDSHEGSGTYVAKGTYLEKAYSAQNSVTEQEDSTSSEDVIDFRSGIPALDLFPRTTWGLIARRVYNETPSSIFGYGHPEGQYELRMVLSEYLARTRGVHCRPNQLVITSGATQAFSLVAKLLASSGKSEVLIEDPVTKEIQTIFKSEGCTLYPVPVDEYGMKTDMLYRDKPSFIFVTPSHQFPFGGTMTIQRRIHLIHFARKMDCYIVEDDYDSEFRHKGTPVSSLQGLDPHRVIYIGTFSKVLSPALRLGYLVLPPSLAEPCRDLKWFADLHTSSFEQLTLAKFIEDGYLEQHIAKMKKLYRKRREKLIGSLDYSFPNRVRIHGDSTGLHLIAEFAEQKFTGDVLEKLMSYHVKVYPVEAHSILKGTHSNKVILGYGNLTLDQIEEGILRLKNSLASTTPAYSSLRNGSV